MSAAPRPQLKDARRQFWWAEHDLIDYGVIKHIGTSAWSVYTCLLRHVNDEGSTFPSVSLLEAETGLSNRVIAQSIGRLKEARLIHVDRESHQWNVYTILDAIHAVKKNRWERVEKKARDEKSPARNRAARRTKQVTNRHVAGDEKSLEQVTNRHPNKSHLKRTKEGGVFRLDGEASPTQLAEQAVSVADTTLVPYSSSTDAALQKTAGVPVESDLGTLTASPAVVPPGVVLEQQPDFTALVVEHGLPEHSSSDVAARQKDEDRPFETALYALIATAAAIPTAVLEQQPPDGGAAGAAEAPEAPSLEEFKSMLVGKSSNTSNPENVPGGAAAGRAAGEDGPSGDPVAPTTASVGELAPIPHAELSSRPLATPDSPVLKALREIVGKDLLTVMAEATRTSGIVRAEYWPRLTVAEIGEARLAAQLEARATQSNMRTLSIRALDRLIGAGPRPKAPPKAEAQAYNGGALAPAKKPEVEAVQEELRYVVGARWKDRKGDAVMSIAGIEPVKGKMATTDHYRLNNGCLLSALDLALKFEFVPREVAGQAAD